MMGETCTFTERIHAGTAKSLVWSGDDLVDWVSGGVRFLADGTTLPRHVNYAFGFDAAVTEPEGEFAVIYTRLGTKGLLLRNGEVVRELNRSFYHANAYEYPITLMRQRGKALLIHCPDEYNKLEIEDAESGEVLTKRGTSSADFFHSRLATSPGGRYLMSAGWVWHPLDAVAYYDVVEALEHPTHLDKLGWSSPTSLDVCAGEETSACWIGDAEALACRAPAEDENTGLIAPGAGFRFEFQDVGNRAARTAGSIDEPAGTMMRVGPDHVVTFYQYPRLVRISDGFVETSMPAISSGVRASAICHSGPPPPPLALDPENGRFAVAQGDGIHVVSVKVPTA